MVSTDNACGTLCLCLTNNESGCDLMDVKVHWGTDSWGQLGLVVDLPNTRVEGTVPYENLLMILAYIFVCLKSQKPPMDEVKPDRPADRAKIISH
jgi:hypothetical protein